MTTREQETLHGHFAHGHSRLTWLMDDLEAHVAGLRSATDAHELILEELTGFATRLTEELREHMGEEESNVFSLVRLRASNVQAEELDEIQREHQRLLGDLEAMWAAIEAARADPTPQIVQCLADTILTLKTNLQHHSSHERRFLADFEAQLHNAELWMPV